MKLVSTFLVIVNFTFLHSVSLFSQTPCTGTAIHWGYVDSYEGYVGGYTTLKFAIPDPDGWYWGVRYRIYKPSGQPNPWTYATAYGGYINVPRCNRYEWEFTCSGLFSYFFIIPEEELDEWVREQFSIGNYQTPPYLDSGAPCQFTACDLNSEPNNTFSTAKRVQVGQTFNSQLSSQGDDDFFSFIPTSGAITIKMNYTNNTTAIVYDKDFNVVPEAMIDLINFEWAALCTPNQLHYVKIFGPNALCATYSIEPRSNACFFIPPIIDVRYSPSDCVYEVYSSSVNATNMYLYINGNFIEHFQGRNFYHRINRYDYFIGVNEITVTTYNNNCEQSSAQNTIEHTFEMCSGESFLKKPKDNLKDNFLMYPNPVKNLLNIEFNGENKGEIEIMNSLGQSVYLNNNSEIKDNYLTINVEKFPKGVYFLVLKNDKVVTKKFVIN